MGDRADGQGLNLTLRVLDESGAAPLPAPSDQAGLREFVKDSLSALPRWPSSLCQQCTSHRHLLLETAQTTKTLPPIALKMLLIKARA